MYKRQVLAKSHAVSRCVKDLDHKMGSCSSSSLEKKSVDSIILLPQQMLDSIKHITDDNFFSFIKITHMCIVCLTQSNWVKYVIFVFRVLPGSAEAQVTWGGTVKLLLIAYFISYISAKKYQNPFMCVKVIASQRWDVFWDTVYIYQYHVIFRENSRQLMFRENLFIVHMLTVYQLSMVPRPV